jgi:F0F1-type ATP synthase epsilon subunit
LTIRTPHEIILQATVVSARVLTETGHVGLRARTEPTVIAVEPGIVHVHPAKGDLAAELFVGTAGGLLMCDHGTATLLTPLAVVGQNEQQIVDQINQRMQRPDSELEARATLSKLESHILGELRQEQRRGAEKAIRYQ